MKTEKKSAESFETIEEVMEGVRVLHLDYVRSRFMRAKRCYDKDGDLNRIGKEIEAVVKAVEMGLPLWPVVTAEKEGSGFVGQISAEEIKKKYGRDNTSIEFLSDTKELDKKLTELYKEWETFFADFPKATGIDLIASERKEQIETHGYSVEGDVENNPWQLRFAINQLVREEGLNKTWPAGWSMAGWEKLISKPYKDRLVIAGALIAAELDRMMLVEEKEKEAKEKEPRPGIDREVEAFTFGGAPFNVSGNPIGTGRIQCEGPGNAEMEFLLSLDEQARVKALKKSVEDLMEAAYDTAFRSASNPEGKNPDYVKRPELGIKPRKFHAEERLNEVRDGIERYIAAGQQVPAAWVEELIELYAEIDNMKTVNG